jgi:RNA polymerase sigma-70 factor (ECF subfamily)
MDSDRVIESVEEAVHRAAEHDEVREMLAELPDSYEEIIRLIYWNGYSGKEIAELYDIPLGTAKTRVRQALKTCRELLAARQHP